MGNMTVVEFFDYRCGVCKRINPIVDELGNRPQYSSCPHEWSLGPNSVLVARAAIAARNQGNYLAFHKVLMEANSYTIAIHFDGKYNRTDTERLRRDMNGKEIDTICKNSAWDKLKLNGTPSPLSRHTAAWRQRPGILRRSLPSLGGEK